MDDSYIKYSFHHRKCAFRAVNIKNLILNCRSVPRLHNINTQTDRANGEKNISRSPVLEIDTEKVFVYIVFI